MITEIRSQFPAETLVRRATQKVTDMSKPTLLERAQAIAPDIQEQAQSCLQERTLTKETVSALADAGLMRMFIPKELGGEEPPLSELYEVVEEISWADGSAGWVMLSNSASMGFAGACLSDDAVSALFGDGDPSRAAGGMFGPAGRGVACENGFRVSGNYRFGSGTNHCAYIAAGFISFVDGKPVMEESGLPDMRLGFVPREKVHFKDGWHVMGMQGTGSYDYDLTDVLIEDGYHLKIHNLDIKRGGTLYRMGMMPIVAGGHAAWALGIARRALEEIKQLASAKLRGGHTDTLAKRTTFQVEYARNAMRLKAAKSLFNDVYGQAWDKVDRGDELSPEDRANLRASAVYITESAKKVCDFMHQYAGTDASRLGNSMVRAYLDMQVGAQHVMVGEKPFTNSAQVLLGVVDDVPGL